MLNRVKVTVPVGLGTAAAVAAVLVTVASSCTTVPGAIVVLFVTSLFAASRTCVMTVVSAQVLLALPQFAVQPAVVLPVEPVVRVTEPTALVNPMLDVACTWVRPETVEVIVTVQVAVAAPPV